MRIEPGTRLKSQRLADLQNETAELERKLSHVRVSLEREMAQSAERRETAPGPIQETYRYPPGNAGPEHEAGSPPGFHATPDPAGGYGSSTSGDPTQSAESRTEVLVNHGRRSAYYARLPLGRKIAIGAGVVAAAVAILVMILASGGASWPSSVATVQNEAAKACQNPDVKSEPGQVNFACAKTTRQILWVFALLTSADNPNFADAQSGRLGLEPIMPAQGGEMAWSLNLHHPYNPSDPIDSLEVAARAINNIVGGATVTGTDGNPVVQPGLESGGANCARYTGSAKVTAHEGFPSLCANPVTSPAGQAALVADIYRKWIVDATLKAAHDAALLFVNAKNPGNSQVQAILRNLPVSKPLA
jgi:hypothetical protein